MTDKRSSLKSDFILPIGVLTCICFVVALLLGIVNSFTAPVIKEAAEKRAQEARLEVMPDADGFTEISCENLPGTIKEVYKADNGAGYVFMITCKGYGGDMELICGVDMDGRITMCKTLSHSETAGMGAKTADDPYRNQYAGKDESLEGVSAITGATISSNSYYNAIKDVFTAYNAVKEVN